MKPPFQRNPVWQTTQKASLIDTILRGFPVPELYIQSNTTGSGDEQHVVVDGQQRIRACMEFIDNRFVLGDDSGSLSGLTFDELDEPMKQRIFKYKFVVRALPSLTETEIRDIFGRLNRNNVALNRQELRHATYWGEFITTVTDLSEESFWQRSGLFTSNDFRRMLDIEYVSELVVASLFGVQNKKDRLDRAFAEFEVEFPDRDLVVETFSTVLSQLQQLFDWPNRLRWSRKVDFYTLFCVLAQRQDSLPFQSRELARVKRALVDLSAQVGQVLSLASDVENDSTISEFAVAYGRGVRNSSDLGSRRLRQQSLRRFVWPKEDAGPQVVLPDHDEDLGHLPEIEELLSFDEDEE